MILCRRGLYITLKSSLLSLNLLNHTQCNKSKSTAKPVAFGWKNFKMVVAILRRMKSISYLSSKQSPINFQGFIISHGLEAEMKFT